MSASRVARWTKESEFVQLRTTEYWILTFSMLGNQAQKKIENFNLPGPLGFDCAVCTADEHQGKHPTEQTS